MTFCFEHVFSKFVVHFEVVLTIGFEILASNLVCSNVCRILFGGFVFKVSVEILKWF